MNSVTSVSRSALMNADYDLVAPALPEGLTRTGSGGRAGAPMMRLVRCCWPIARRLLTNQYTTSPAGAHRNETVNTTGMNRNIFCWIGSAVVGIIFCCQNIVNPINTGVTY